MANMILYIIIKYRRMVFQKQIMGSYLEDYRSAIGIFHCTGSKRALLSQLYFWNFILPNFLFCHMVLPNLILLAGDIESNPGPVLKQLTLCHLNIRSLLAKDDN